MIPPSACRPCPQHDRPSLAARPETSAGSYTTHRDTTSARTACEQGRKRIPRLATRSVACRARRISVPTIALIRSLTQGRSQAETQHAEGKASHALSRLGYKTIRGMQKMSQFYIRRHIRMRLGHSATCEHHPPCLAFANDLCRVSTRCFGVLDEALVGARNSSCIFSALRTAFWRGLF